MKVLVIGDSMLDRYWTGTADRLSPEAPVPVLTMREEHARPGGAANVAANLHALGCEVVLATLLGDDAAGHELVALLPGVEMRPVGIAQTTTKIRAVSRRQQLLRIDTECEPHDAALRAFAGLASDLVRQHPIVVLSDYGKGALSNCQRIIEAATAANCRVLVDPKGRDWGRYMGAWLLKPNEAELAEVVGPWKGDTDFTLKAEGVRRTLGLVHLLVTRGERGMVLFSRGVAPLVVDAEAREVFDVSGAGDTVIATLTCMLARGHLLRDAVLAANKAAGIVVGRFGTSTVAAAELDMPCA